MSKRRKQKNLRNEIIGVTLIAVALIFAVAIYDIAEGTVVEAIKDFTFGLIGVINYATPVLLIALGIFIIAASNKKTSVSKTIFIIVGAVSLLSIIQLIYIGAELSPEQDYLEFLGSSYTHASPPAVSGGLIGSILLYPMHLALGLIPAYIVFFLLVIISVLVTTRISIKEMSKNIGKVSKSAAVSVASNVTKVYETQRAKKATDSLYVDNLNGEDKELNNNIFLSEELPRPRVRKNTDETERAYSSKGGRVRFSNDGNITKKGAYYGEIDRGEPKKEEKEEQPIILETQDLVEDYDFSYDQIEDTFEESSEEYSGEEYIKPTVDMLVKPPTKARKNAMDATMKNAKLLEETLLSFGVNAKVIDVSRGPVVTRYELAPAPGVKISRIVQLSDDIALNLAAPRVRIEAPIPGKAAVGIEVPNAEIDSVYIYEMLTSPDYQKYLRKAVLPFALGQDLAGKNIYADINSMPHLLIAGSTGSGKSVCVNGLIISLLMNSAPDEVKLIMIDPKVVELSVYNNIPHLMVPVVTDPKKAASALNWAVAEMTKRYKTFADKGAKDIKKYNMLIEDGEEEKMPYLVIIIDELADLMMTCQNEVEDAICRIAQLGRACGIHLVIATQRPSVDVITGLIKANIPSRIAFAVSSQIDSRTILDMAGAEKLLGKGDMLYYPIGVPKPIRMQGAFIQDKEVEAVTRFLKHSTSSNYDTDVMDNLLKPVQVSSEEDDDADVLLPKAIEVGLEYGSVSISMIQRRLRVGYARAARLLDEMEIRGYVSAFEGSKPRQMLITREDYEYSKENI